MEVVDKTVLLVQDAFGIISNAFLFPCFCEEMNRTRGKRRGFSPGAAARHSQFARVQGRAATERFSVQLPRAHWIGPE